MPLTRTVISALCLLAAYGGCQSTVRAAAADGEIILYHAHVFTADTGHPYADAVAIRGDRIVAVGTLTSVATAVSPSARRVDLQGKFLMPGMIDAHAHPIAGGEVLGSARYKSEEHLWWLIHRRRDHLRAGIVLRSRTATNQYGHQVPTWQWNPSRRR